MVIPNEERTWKCEEGKESPYVFSATTTLTTQQTPFPSTTQSPSAGTTRRRSVSVASAQPSVETVISKAKRAAKTLWTLLHAQHCTLADGCIHPGCKEAKLLLLHLKTCPAGTSFSCPTNHRGCDQGRKLLAHYKRCKSLRARQLGQASLRREPSQQQVCLVCNLVARQARSILEQPSKPPSTSYPVGGPLPSATTAAVRKPSGSSRRIISSFMLDSSNCVVKVPTESFLTSPKMMPPPPPRAKVEEAAPLSVSEPREPSTGFQSPPLVCLGVSSPAATQLPTKEGDKSVSFHGDVLAASRGRALSHSEGPTQHNDTVLQQEHLLLRPRSHSMGAVLACDTINEESLETEPHTAEYEPWSPVA